MSGLTIEQQKRILDGSAKTLLRDLGVIENLLSEVKYCLTDPELREETIDFLKKYQLLHLKHSKNILNLIHETDVIGNDQSVMSVCAEMENLMIEFATKINHSSDLLAE